MIVSPRKMSLPVSSSGKHIGQYGQISLNIPVFMLQSRKIRYSPKKLFVKENDLFKITEMKKVPSTALTNSLRTLLNKDISHKASRSTVRIFNYLILLESMYSVDFKLV
jgi:hypothetical protein